MTIDWDNYRARLIQAGASAEDAQRQVEQDHAERSAVERGECPRCHRPITPIRDPRQSGPSPVKGTWYQVRCSNCRYMADFLMPDTQQIGRTNGMDSNSIIGDEMTYSRHPSAIKAWEEYEIQNRNREYEFFLEGRRRAVAEWEKVRPQIFRAFAGNPDIRNRFETQFALVRNWFGDPSQGFFPFVNNAQNTLRAWKRMVQLADLQAAGKFKPKPTTSAGAMSLDNSASQVVEYWDSMVPSVHAAFAAEPSLLQLFEVNRQSARSWASQSPRPPMHSWWIQGALHWKLLVQLATGGL